MEIFIVAVAMAVCGLIFSALKSIRRGNPGKPTKNQKHPPQQASHGGIQSSPGMSTGPEVVAMATSVQITDWEEAASSEPTVSTSATSASSTYGNGLQGDRSSFAGTRFFVGTNGSLVSSDEREVWLSARREGVSGTDLKRIVLLNGAPSTQRSKLLQEKLSGYEGPRLAQFEHGITREPIIAAWVAAKFGIDPNRLLCIGLNPRHLATPDGIGTGVVCEIKTSIKPLASAAKTYRDQIQWQLHVTGASKSLFVVENRSSLEREYAWIARDEARIAVLEAHANHFLEELDAAKAGQPFEAPAPVIHSTQPMAAVKEEHAVPWSPDVAEALDTSGSLAEDHVSDKNLPQQFGRQQQLRHAEQRAQTWATEASMKLLFDYHEGASLMEILRDRSWATEEEILQELSHQLLNVQSPLNRKPSQRRKRTWTYNEWADIESRYYTGVWLPSLAKELDCEQIDIAFALFAMRLPEVPVEFLDDWR
ncbi:YqaJ viral recombinase family protein [Arthrobacter sp. 35W]|uniref:YqaJ viral recombinase family protein n=1 Tax=Arthrobacter sp. 35W TaxID=1132441 RepID=UPI000427E7C7|nr:YqaJ viral recombinase family protein [Arthrobacter sp. 35W]